ncbi:MAG: hypothetical protein DI629_12270 [Mesorhizobium amorphae]|nr:MAG: hypothetical protein DI629_12270 [Mesorhizobium amorphae]
MMRKRFQMSEISRRNREISRRETEMLRAEAIQSEMAAAVRRLGGDGPAKEQISRAARYARLPATVVERLRWKKIKRVPADIADAVREAVERHNVECQNRADHELYLARRQNAVLAARLAEVDPAYARLVPSLDGREGPAVGVRTYPGGGR